MQQTDEMGPAEVVKLIVGIVVAIILVIAFFWAIETVDAGTVKVVTRFGQVTGRTLDPGIAFLVPFADSTIGYNTKKVIYETTIEEKQKGSDADYKDFPVDTNTSDGQQVDIFYTIRFSIDPSKAGFIAQNLGDERAVVDKIVKTESRIWARNIPREFTAETLYTGDGVVEVQRRIEEKLRPTFEANGLHLDSVGIREIKFTDQYIGAIEAKQIEAVKVDTAEQIAARAKFEKEASITEAEAEAEKQRLLSTSVTQVSLQREWISKWNGVLPTYITGDATNLLLQLPR